MGLFLPARCLGEGLQLLFHPQLRLYVAVPLLINSALFAGAIWYLSDQFDNAIDWLLPGWLDWLIWLLWPLFFVMIAVMLFYSFTLVANLLGAPFNEGLSKQVEALDSNLVTDASAGGVTAGLAMELHKLLHGCGWFLVALIITLIPGINLIAPAVWLLLGAWLCALEYLEYPLTRRGYDFKQLKGYLRAAPITTLQFGGGVLLLTLIPGVNLVVMPTAVIAATRLVERLEQMHDRSIDQFNR